MSEENKNSEALAILSAPATAPAAPATDTSQTVDAAQAGAMGVTAADTTVPGTTTPAGADTVPVVASPAAEGTTPTTATTADGGNLLYKPMFSVRTEKFIYVTCVLLSLGAIVVSVIAGDLNWPRVVGDTCGVMGGLVGSLASAFGVSYTTMRAM